MTSTQVNRVSPCTFTVELMKEATKALSDTEQPKPSGVSRSYWGSHLSHRRIGRELDRTAINRQI